MQDYIDMKKLLLYGFLLCSLTSSARGFYFANAGNDANTFAQAQSSLTPWATVTKLNAQMASMTAGDTIYFKKGDTFAGVGIVVNISGLIFTSYGTGANPVISGFTDITWTSLGSNLYESQVIGTRPEVVIINGAARLPARMPKSGFYTFSSSSGTNSITSAALSGGAWTGADIVVRKNHTTWDRGLATQSGTTITFTGGDANPFASNGWGFFLQNHPDACTQQNEWYYASTKVTCYSTSAPTGKASTVGTLFAANGYNVTINGVDFTGSQELAIHVQNGSSCSITNCNITNNGNVGIVVVNNPGTTLQDNTLTNTYNVGIVVQTCTNAIIRGNVLDTVGVLGKGSGTVVTDKQDYFGIGIWDASTSALCELNTLKNIGFNGINFYYSNTVTIQKNFIQKHNLYKGDGSGIYTYVAGAGTYTGITVANNIVIDGGGEDAGRSDVAYQSVYGIYMDDDVDNVTIDGNVCANQPAAGIFLHSCQSITVTNNLCYNNGNASIDIASASQIQLLSNTYTITGLVISGNIFFARTTDQYLFQADYSTNTISSSIPTLNFNYYCHPINEGSHVARRYISGDPSAVTHTFSSWKTYTGKDAASAQTFKTVTSVDSIRFEYNATNATVVRSLPYKYVDHAGNPYDGAISLGAYVGVVLLYESAATASNRKVFFLKH